MQIMRHIFILILLGAILSGCAGGELDSQGRYTIPIGETQAQEDAGKFFGIVYLGESKDDVIINIGYPKNVYDKGEYNIWYYDQITLAKTGEVLKKIEIYFLNGRVKDCQLVE